MIIESIAHVKEFDFGNKANNVIRMFQENIRVPKSWVISHKYIMRQIEKYLAISLYEKVDDYSRIIEFFENYPIELYNELYQEVKKMANGFEKKVSLVVRSSHLLEDGDNYSFSGLFTTEINITKLNNIVEAIISCWRNCFSKSVLKYFYMSNNQQSIIPCAILIQEFIPSEVAGVMFKYGTNVCINSTWGMAKSIVDGSTGYDSWLLDTEGVEKNYTNSKNEINMPVFALTNPREGEVLPFFLSENNVKVKEFSNSKNYICAQLIDSLRSAKSLNEVQIKELVNISAAVSKKLNIVDCDIEWAYSKNTLYMLQCRSITRRMLEPTLTSCDDFLPLVGGSARGKCYFVSSESEAKVFPKGSILVAKRLTGSVLLAATKASGCILESKSPLSHSAIIARELGIPAVGAVDIKKIILGEDYEIDGEKGTIIRIKCDTKVKTNNVEDGYTYDWNDENVMKIQAFITEFCNN